MGLAAGGEGGEDFEGPVYREPVGVLAKGLNEEGILCSLVVNYNV